MCTIFKGNYTDGRKAVGNIISHWGGFYSRTFGALRLAGDHWTKRYNVLFVTKTDSVKKGKHL